MANDPTPGQQSIRDGGVGGGCLDGQSCEWCGSDTPATVALPVLRKVKGGKAGATLPTGMHVYACAAHREIAEKSNPVRHAL